MRVPGAGRIRRLVSPSLQRVRGYRRPLILWSGNGWGQSVGGSYLRLGRIASGLAERGWGDVYCPAPCSGARFERILKGFRPDLVVVHKARQSHHRAEHLAGYRYVVDLDDADFLDSGMSERLAELCGQAVAVVAGSRYVRDWCARHCERVRVIWTGTPEVKAGAEDGLPGHRERGVEVTWAASDPRGYPQEAALVRAVMKLVGEACPGVRLRVYGVKPEHERWFDDWAVELRSVGVACEHRAPMSYDAFLRSVSGCSIGLGILDTTANTFSLGKSFGKVLAYLSTKTVCVVNRAADHALFFRDGQNGVLCDDADELSLRIAQLIADPALRQALADQAYRDFRERLSADAAVEQWERLLVDDLGLVPGSV